MGTQQVKLLDVAHAGHVSRLRLLAPLRYLAIRHPEKTRYDVLVPLAVGFLGWAAYSMVEPKPQLFGEEGLLRFARDLLIMAVPFMIGALAAVSMGAPGPHLDRRPIGMELRLDDQVLTLRQFLCYLLGYLCFLGLITLLLVVAAGLLREAVVAWTSHTPLAHGMIVSFGTLMMSFLFSFLTMTVFWSLYFLTDIANQTNS
jgi:hypothetical protein